MCAVVFAAEVSKVAANLQLTMLNVVQMNFGKVQLRHFQRIKQAPKGKLGE